MNDLYYSVQLATSAVDNTICDGSRKYNDSLYATNADSLMSCFICSNDLLMLLLNISLLRERLLLLCILLNDH
jgi:hypothetical protein